jgi:hypothetical protein
MCAHFLLIIIKNLVFQAEKDFNPLLAVGNIFPFS